MDKILSIIIPTYNMEKYLRRCLDSLLVDNIGLLEVIVVNDGSMDTSSDIAHEYSNKYPESFSIIDKPNGNYGSCINAALKQINGKYVKVLDADDFYDNANFSLFLDKLESTEADMVLTDYDIVNEQGVRTAHVNFDIKREYLLPFTDISEKKCIKNIAMHGITYRTSIFDSLDYLQSEGISYTDQEWIFSPMSRVNNVIYYPLSIYQYFVGREGQTMAPAILVKNISHTIEGIYKMCEDYKRFNFENDIKHKPYLDYLLSKRCKYIYRNFLVSHPDLPIDHVIAFDKKLMSSGAKIYDMMDNIVLSRKFPIPFVRLWRKSDYRKNLLLLRICRIFDLFASLK